MKCLAIIIFGLFAAGIHSHPQLDTRFKRDTSGKSLTQLAYEENNDGINAYKGDVDERNAGGFTALIVAAKEGYVETVKLLLEKGANIESRTTYGGTALTWAVVMGRKEVIKLLLEKGANTEAADGDGRTPLILAAERGWDDVVRALLEHGADRTKKDNEGRSAKDVATEEGHTAVVVLLNQWTVHNQTVEQVETSKGKEEHSAVAHTNFTQPIQQIVNPQTEAPGTISDPQEDTSLISKQREENSLKLSQIELEKAGNSLKLSKIEVEKAEIEVKKQQDLAQIELKKQQDLANLEIEAKKKELGLI